MRIGPTPQRHAEPGSIDKVVPRLPVLRKYPRNVADAPRVISAEELDAMSPGKRAQVVREPIVTDLDHLPEAFRQRVETTAARLAEQLRPVTE